MTHLYDEFWFNVSDNIVDEFVTVTVYRRVVSKNWRGKQQARFVKIDRSPFSRSTEQFGTIEDTARRIVDQYLESDGGIIWAQNMIKLYGNDMHPVSVK
jgi:hypothetical protein